MNINAVRLVSIRVITDFVIMCKKTYGSHVYLNVCMLILFSLAATHYCLSNITAHKILSIFIVTTALHGIKQLH